MTGHAYGLVDVFELKDDEINKVHRMLRVRNPWGKMEWKGKWSDNSDEIEKYKPLLDQYIASLETDE